jgi:hypothetical protein
MQQWYFPEVCIPGVMKRTHWKEKYFALSLFLPLICDQYEQVELALAKAKAKEAEKENEAKEKGKEKADGEGDEGSETVSTSHLFLSRHCAYLGDSCLQMAAPSDRSH